MMFESSHDSLSILTASSAADFKLWFCGILLRSKTTKPRLKNCPRSAATGAATTCYKCSCCDRMKLPSKPINRRCQAMEPRQVYGLFLQRK